MVILHFFLTTPLIGRSGFFWWDTYLRLETSEAPWTTFYFFWTNFFYLPSLFSFILLGLFTFYLSKSWPKVGVLFAFPLLLATSELHDVLTTAHALILNNFTTTTPNLLLSNFLNRYHPFLLYFGIGWTFLLVLTSQIIALQGTGLTKTWLRTQIVVIKFWAIYFTFIALSLGSWWAFQEGTWGGWWNWDPSETFGLLFFLLALLPWHLKNLPKTDWKGFTYLKVLLQITVVIYFFIQLNFDLVSHNFGVQFFYFFNNNLFLLQTTSIILFWVWSRERIVITCSKVEYLGAGTNRHTHQLILLTTISALFITILLYSFQSLSHNFLQKFLSVNCGNEDLVFSKLNLLLIPYFLNFFTPINFFKLLPTFLLVAVLPNPLLILPGLSYLRLTQTYRFHVTLWTFFLLNLLLTEPNAPYLTSTPPNPPSTLNLSHPFYNDFNFILDGGGIQSSNHLFTSSTELVASASELSNFEAASSTNIFWLWVSTLNLCSNLQIINSITEACVSVSYEVTATLFLLSILAFFKSQNVLRPYLLTV